MIPKIISEKFIKSEGYWFNVVQEGENTYTIVNTRRKINRIDRDNIEFYTEHSFDNEDEAKKFLNNMI